MTDEQALRELLGSVYVTPRQRAALHRVMVTRGVDRAPFVGNATLGASTVMEEEERHALLGPCGAE
jgi:hypothetical protein